MNQTLRSLQRGACPVGLILVLLSGRSASQPSETLPPGISMDAVAVLGETAYFLGRTTSPSGSSPLNLFSYDLGDGTATPLFATEEARLWVNNPQYLSASAASQRLAFCRTPGFISPEVQGVQIVIFDLERGTIERVIDNGRENSWPVFSPDGQALAFFSAPAGTGARRPQDFAQSGEGYAVHVVELPSGQETEIAPQNVYPFPQGPPAWSPSSDRVVFTARFEPAMTSMVCIAPRDGGDLRILGRPGDYEALSAVWPQERAILFLGSELGERAGQSPGLFIMNAESGSYHLQIPAATFRPETLSLSPDRSLVRFDEVSPSGQTAERIATSEGRTSTVDASSMLFHGAWRQ